MINIFTFLFCLIAFFDVSLATSSIVCSPKLQSCLTAIEMLPEAKKLLDSIQQEGPIRITTSNSSLAKQFGAFWDPDDRVICVNLAFHSSEGKLIGSILFELHNASINSKLEHLDFLAYKKKINRDHYVESVERLEYQNSKNAAALAEKGVQLGIFPSSARLPTYRNFEEHFRMQQEGGHSSQIAHNYDQLSH